MIEEEQQELQDLEESEAVIQSAELDPLDQSDRVTLGIAVEMLTDHRASQRCVGPTVSGNYLRF